jgi:hypothetical protein
MNNLFAKNLEYFYNEIPQYYELIKNIKTRRFKIINNNGFNILDTKTNTYFYPVENGKHLMQEISEVYANNPMKNDLWIKYFLTKEMYEYDEKILPITSKIVNKIIKITKSSKDFTDNGYYYDKNFLYTTSIFGLGSGLHVKYLIEKYDFQSLFIYEPEVEFFAISCYFIDWQKAFEKLKDKLFLFVKGNIDTKVLKHFYDSKVITSNFLRLEFNTYNSPKIENAKKEFYLANISNKRGWGSFEDEMVGFKNHLKNINKNIPILTKTTKINAPICVVANGASLENDIEWIKENQNNLIIISVGTAIRPLLKAGIHSDFHIEIERMPELVKILKPSLENYSGYFVGASVIDSEHFKIAKKPLMFVRDASSTTGISNFFLKFCSPMVGNTGFSFAAHLSDEIYMCGFDVGFHKNKRVHASGSYYDDKDDTKEGSPVRGNFRDEVLSDDLLNLSRQNLEMTIAFLKPKKVYNLSDGAFINGAIPKHSNEIKLTPIKKDKYIKEIIQNFKIDKIKTLNYSGFLELYKNKIIELLDKEIKNKKELTETIDLVNDYTLAFLRYEPAVGTLMKGSIWHILNTIYVSLHKTSLKEYPKMVKIIKKEIKKYKIPKIT